MLYAEELFGVEGFVGRSSLLYHRVPPTQTHRIESLGAGRARGGRRWRPSPPADQERGPRAEGRCDHRTGAALLQRGRDVRCRPARRADARDDLLSERRGGRALLRPRGQGPVRQRVRRRSAMGPATTSSSRSGRPGGWRRTRARPSGCSGSSARARSSRRSATATTTASCSSTARIRSATSGSRRPSRPRTDEGEFRVHVKARGRRTAYHYTTHPFDVVGWDGYLWPFELQHRRLRADHRPDPSAAAGPPDVPGPQLRRLLVRARASSTTTRSRSRRRTTTRTSTATRSSTTSPATS